MYPGIVQQQNLSEDALFNLLFGNSQQGSFWPFYNTDYLFQDTSGTIPVTTDGDPVALVIDKNGYNNAVSAGVDHPVYRTDGIKAWLEFSQGTEYFVAGIVTQYKWLHECTGASTAIAVQGNDTLDSFMQLFGTGDRGASGQVGGHLMYDNRAAASGGRIGLIVSRSTTGTYTYSFGDTSTSTGSAPQNTDLVFSLSWDIDEQSTYINSTLETNVGPQTLPPATGNSTNPFHIGNSGSHDPQFYGRMYGLIVSDEVWSVGVRKKVEQYLANKAGITLP